MKFGVCYYPEHWARADWRAHLEIMRDHHIEWVRVGEFAWHHLQPTPDTWTPDWLREWFDLAEAYGRKVLLGTPSATPPHWMLAQHPDMLAVDQHGNPRTFGARRQYCFSHLGYRGAAAAMAGRLAELFAEHPALGAWQTDNEFGCHETSLSYSPGAHRAFAAWLEERYGTIDALNTAWGNTFWSQTYPDFATIPLPNFTVTEANPSHWLDFRRFSSDQVVLFQRAQVEAIRAHDAAHPILHNFMAAEQGFDHYDAAVDLDIAGWDNYPLGFLATMFDDPAHKQDFLRTGDPDFQAFHHTLYRGLKQRLWVVEQQPGAVNWATYNPRPSPDTLALWVLEAYGHGAEVVSWFRFRQAHFAQEQMHEGLLNIDGSFNAGLDVMRQLHPLLAADEAEASSAASIALVYDYPSAWAWATTPHSEAFSYLFVVLTFYRALRARGHAVDIIGTQLSAEQLRAYTCILAPALLALDDAPSATHPQPHPDSFQARLKASGSFVVCGPRTHTKTPSMQARQPAPADPLAIALHVESLPDSARIAVTETASSNELPGGFRWWHELHPSPANTLWHSDAGAALWELDHAWQIAGVPDADLARAFVLALEHHQRIPVGTDLPHGVRIIRRGMHIIVLNFSDRQVHAADIDIPLGSPVFGTLPIPPGAAAVCHSPKPTSS